MLMNLVIVNLNRRLKNAMSSISKDKDKKMSKSKKDLQMYKEKVVIAFYIIALSAIILFFIFIAYYSGYNNGLNIGIEKQYNYTLENFDCYKKPIIPTKNLGEKKLMINWTEPEEEEIFYMNCSEDRVVLDFGSFIINTSMRGICQRLI